jgi:hypothetical protein
VMINSRRSSSRSASAPPHGPSRRVGREPAVGDLELSYETLTLDVDDGRGLPLYTAEADSPSQQALDMLASWTATPDAMKKRTFDEARER